MKVSAGKMRIFLIGFAVTACAAGVSVLFAGCQGVPTDGKSTMVSAGGIKAESLLPSNVFMVMKAGTSDPGQIALMNQMMNNFPENPVEALLAEAAAGFNEGNAEYGFDFERDVLPAVGENWQLMFTMGGDIEEDDDPILMAVLMPADSAKIEEFMKKLPENGKGSEIKSGSYTIYSNESENAFFARYEDVILFSNNMDELVKRLSSTEGNLFGNEFYRQGSEKMHNKLGFVFIDPSYVINQMNTNIAAEEDLEQMERMLEISSTVKGEFFGLSAEADGLRIEGSVFVDMAKWKELELPDLNDQPDSYLYKVLPGENLLVYMESADLKMSVEMLMDMYKEIDELSNAFSMIRAGLAMQKLDLDDDVLAFMDKGYAFSMNASSGLMPTLGLYFDAVSNPEGAEKVMERIFEGIEGMMEEGQMDEDVAKIFSHGKADCGAGVCYSMNVDFTGLPEEKKIEMNAELAKEKISFEYGVNGDNLAFFTLYPGFTAGVFETVENDAGFKEALGYIPGYGSQTSYMDVEGLTVFIDKWVRFGMEVEGNDMNEGMEDYEMVMNYLKPFKYIVAGSRDVSGNEMAMQMFIKISK